MQTGSISMQKNIEDVNADGEYVKAENRGGVDTRTDPRRRRSSPRRRRSKVIAKEANALFQSDSDGVLFRMVHPDLKALDQDKSSPTSMSWARLNKYAVYNNLVQLYKDGTRVAIMAKKHANEHVKCQYPCDGDTDGRHYNCHVQGCPCHASGNGEWCTHSLHGLGPHKACAFKSSETAKMMKAFKDVQKGSSPLLKGYVSPWNKGQEPSACGYYHAIGLGHNEVIIDARTWDKHIKDNIWAIVKTDKCTGACETQLKALQKDHTSKYGHLPLLHFNRHDITNPFSSPEKEEEQDDEQDEASNMSSLFV
jgi:hypothetical protein